MCAAKAHLHQERSRRDKKRKKCSKGLDKCGHIEGKILNHVEPGVTKVYDRHSYDAEKRQALEAWGHKVTALVTGETVKVILLQRKTID